MPTSRINCGKTPVLLLLLGFVILAFALVGQAQGQFANVAELLEIGAGARPLGMGSAFVGLADDENAGFYNPAGLAFLDQVGITSLYTRQFQLMDYGVIAVAGRFAGVTLLQLHSGGIEGTNEFGNPDGESFAYTARAGIASAGVPWGKVALGTRLKLYQEFSQGASGIGWALDPAVLLVQGGLRLGALLQNFICGEIEFDNGHVEEWNPHLQFGGSLSVELLEKIRMKLLIEVSRVLEGGLHGHFGTELWVSGLGVRAGLDGGAITLGSSIWLERIRIDWAYAAHRQLPDTNRLSLTLRF